MLSDSKRLRRIPTNSSLCPSITSIDLGHNRIGDKGCKALAAALPQCPSITSIDLGDNKIGDEGCKALAATLLQCP